MRPLLHRLMFILFPFSFIAQELPPFQNFTPSTYEAGNQNWGVTRDAQGNMYFANEKGLLKYNGARWELFTMPNKSITRSVFSNEDRIYTGCYMDFGFWQEDSQGILSYTSLATQIQDVLQEDEQFWQIYALDNYVLFQSLSGIYSYNTENGSVDLLTREDNIWNFFRLGSDFYYQVIDEGLFRISNRSGILVDGSEEFKSRYLIEMFEHEGDQYALFKNGGLVRFSEHGLSDPVMLSDKNIQIYNAVFLSDSETLVMGTIQNGVIRTHLNGDKIFEINREKGLENNTVLSIFYNDGELWLGLDNGISFVELDSSISRYVDQIGKLGTVYSSLDLGPDRYLGTNQGLFIWDGYSKMFKQIPNTSGQVWKLSNINGRLYGHHDRGLFVLDNNEARFIFKKSGVWDSFYDRNKQVFLLGCYDGIYRSPLNNENLEFEKLKGFDISSKDFTVVGDEVFVSHEYKGVFKFKIEEGSNRVIDLIKFEDLKLDNTSDLVKFSGNVLFSNGNNIFKYDKDLKEFKISQSLTEIFNEGGYESSRMEVTTDGALWFFTNKALYKTSLDNINGDYAITAFNLNKDAREDMTGYENISYLGQNRYLVGTTYGYLILDTNILEEKIPDIKIDRLKNSNTLQVINQFGGESIEFPYNQNNLQIDYSSRSYDPLSPVLYQFRLNNLPWSEWSSDSTTLLNNLDHGIYEFQVRSKLDSASSAGNASIKFEILKPFYFTTAAIIFYVLALFAIGYGIHFTYKWYYKRQKNRAIARHQKELEVMSLQTENELIQMRNEKLKTENEFRSKELAVATMSTIRKNELLNEVQAIAQKLPDSAPARELRKMVKKNLTSKKDWISFEEAFNNADKDFFKKIKAKHPSLTPGDLRLCVYLRLNLSSKEIAPLLHISPRSVEIKRYRLRKKMDLEKEVNLSDYIMSV